MVVTAYKCDSVSICVQQGFSPLDTGDEEWTPAIVIITAHSKENRTYHHECLTPWTDDTGVQGTSLCAISTRRSPWS